MRAKLPTFHYGLDFIIEHRELHLMLAVYIGYSFVSPVLPRPLLSI